MSIQEHLSILLNLSAIEREEISRALWKSLELNENSIGVSDYEKKLLTNREDRFKKGEISEDSWENVKQRLVEKINKQ